LPEFANFVYQAKTIPQIEHYQSDSAIFPVNRTIIFPGKQSSVVIVSTHEF